MSLSIHMWLLIVVMAITLFYARMHKNKVGKKRCIACITVLLTCFGGLRSWQMGDVYHYCYAYLACNQAGWTLDWKSHDSIGTQLFYRVAGQMGISFEVCLFLIAAFCAITLGVLVYRYSSSPYMSYLLYICLGLYLFTLSGLKQSIAMGFVMIAMMAILERKPLKFFAFVLIAALFHTPALIFAVAYPFANKRIDLYYFLLLAIVIAAIVVFRDKIVAFASDLYYDDEVEFASEGKLGGKTIMMLLILAAAMYIRPLRNYDRVYCKLFNLMVIAAIIQSFSVYDNVFTRLADYYYQFFILFVPLVLEPGTVQAHKYPDHRREIRYLNPKLYPIMILGITVFSVLFYKNTLQSSQALLSEFHFFWQVDAPNSLDLLKR